MSKVALIDLDGTCADYDTAMEVRLIEMMSPSEKEEYCKRGCTYDRNLSHIKARRDAIARTPGFWSGLAPIPNGMRIVSLLRNIGFQLMVLSKGPSSKSLAWSEKVDWCRQWLPGIPVCLTEDKSGVYGRVLVDDWPAYYEPWLDHRPRGLVVSVARPENKTIPEQYQSRVFRYTGADDYVALRERLQEAFDR